jgi:hypothetical protein
MGPNSGAESKHPTWDTRMTIGAFGRIGAFAASLLVVTSGAGGGFWTRVGAALSRGAFGFCAFH